MALIKCPECGNEISDQAEQCIKCGYPIKKIHNQQHQNTEDETTIINRIKEIYYSNRPKGEKLDLLNKMVLQNPRWDLYCWMGKILAADNNDCSLEDAKQAIEYCKKALTFDTVDSSIVHYITGKALCNMANIEKKFEIWEEAIYNLEKSQTTESNLALGNLYDPANHYYEYPRKDVDKSLHYYLKCVNEINEPNLKSLVLNSIGFRFSDKGSDLGAAIYTFLAYRYKSDTLYKKNYETFISRYNKKTGSKIQKRIEKLQNPMEAAKLIDDIQTGKACPTCGFSSITTGARGFGGFWGHIGATQTVNRCSTCGYTWTPKI